MMSAKEFIRTGMERPLVRCGVVGYECKFTDGVQCFKFSVISGVNLASLASGYNISPMSYA